MLDAPAARVPCERPPDRRPLPSSSINLEYYSARGRFKRCAKMLSGRLGLLSRHRLAGDGGAAHVARLRVVETAHPMHGLPVVPHHQVVLLPAMDVDVL